MKAKDQEYGARIQANRLTHYTFLQCIDLLEQGGAQVDEGLVYIVVYTLLDIRDNVKLPMQGNDDELDAHINKCINCYVDLQELVKSICLDVKRQRLGR